MTTAFLSLIYLISLLIAIGGHLFFPSHKQIAILAYLLVPGIIGIAFIRKEKIPYRLFRPYLNGAQLKAWLAGWLWFLITLGVSSFWQRPEIELLFASLTPLVQSTHLPPVLLLLAVTLFTSFISAFTIQFVFAALQEVIWRGVLVHKFQSLGFWSGALLIGLLWGLWQAPAVILLGYRYPGDPLASAALGLIFSLALTPFLLWIAIDSFHIGVAAVFYATINSFAPLLNTLFGNRPSWLVGYGGAASILALLLFNGWVFFRLKREEAVPVVENAL